MTFTQLQDNLNVRFPRRGTLDLLPGESINDVVRREAVPNAFGVYFIYRELDCKGSVIYIGKAGTIKQDGTDKRQGIGKRLTMKQGGMFRRYYFQRVIRDMAPNGLSFAWFVTYDGTQKALPALVEAELLAAYFDEFGVLPRLNRAF